MREYVWEQLWCLDFNYIQYIEIKENNNGNQPSRAKTGK